jgi:hypothetical protein
MDRFLALAVMGVLATTAVASAAPAPESGPSSLTRLSASEVRALFSKNLIIRQGAPGRLGNISDEFTAKGRYFQSGMRMPLMGSYVIRGDLVCIDEGLRAEEKCRAFYRSPDGDLWQTIRSEGASTVVALGLIQIERTPNTLKGM